MWELYGIVGMLTSKKLGQHESSAILARMATELTKFVSIVFTMMVVSYHRQINHGEPFGPRNHSLGLQNFDPGTAAQWKHPIDVLPTSKFLGSILFGIHVPWSTSPPAAAIRSFVNKPGDRS